MGRLFAFVDEFGDNGLNFDNPRVPSHFLVTAIIVDESNITDLEIHINNIRQQYFNGSEMKSSKVGKDHNRRLKILQELVKGRFHIYTLIVDKQRLYTEGFKYKQPFYKFLSSLLYRDLFRKYPNLQIVADEFGDKSYMNSFKKYVQTKHMPDLFSESTFGFSNSKSTSLVQIADFIVGTLARKYDRTVIDENADDFLKIMTPLLLPIFEFPLNNKSYIYDISIIEGFDEIIAQTAINQALHFIEDNRKKEDDNIIDQIKCLEYLVFHFRYIDPTKYIPTQELIEKSRSRTTQTQSFRMNVIAQLRDKGVIISSCSHGYKIPMNMSDMYDFVNYYNSFIQPMVARLRKARITILQTSRNDIDILNQEEYQSLKRIVEVFE